MTPNLQIEYRPIDALLPYARNPRTHSPEQIAKIAASIVEFGWTQPILVDGDNGIIAGHGRLAAARKLELVEVPVIELGHLSPAQKRAYPFFERTTVKTSMGEEVELIDGGYCANNPTLYALADAVQALKRDRRDVRLVSVGVGVYPDPKPGFLMRLAKKYLVSVQLLQKTLEINTQSMDELRKILFPDVPTIRISDTYADPEMATDLLEHDLKKLDILFQRGRQSFASREKQLYEYLM